MPKQNIESETQFDDLRRTQGVRVNLFPLGLEDIFIELLGPGLENNETENVLCRK